MRADPAFLFLVFAVFNVGRRRGFKKGRKTKWHQRLADKSNCNTRSSDVWKSTLLPRCRSSQRKGKRALPKHSHFTTTCPEIIQKNSLRTMHSLLPSPITFLATFRVARLTLQTRKLRLVGVVTDSDARHACFRFFSFYFSCYFSLLALLFIRFFLFWRAQKIKKKKKVINNKEHSKNEKN